LKQRISGRNNTLSVMHIRPSVHNNYRQIDHYHYQFRLFKSEHTEMDIGLLIL